MRSLLGPNVLAPGIRVSMCVRGSVWGRRVIIVEVGWCVRLVNCRLFQVFIFNKSCLRVQMEDGLRWNVTMDGREAAAVNALKNGDRGYSFAALSLVLCEPGSAEPMPCGGVSIDALQSCTRV